MNDKVKELYIISKDTGSIFDTGDEYVIPLYQRAYAWEDKQLIQLIEDINDVEQDTNYYIGALIVSKLGNRYEVVDGQQRLTSLFLLLSCLGYKLSNNLKFACRDKSNYTLENINKIILDDRSTIDPNREEENILRGVRIIQEEISRRIGEGTLNYEDFKDKLSRVIVYRIEVPENTDLNRYFEIMNTRGEQLEQHDILKALLMSNLPSVEERSAFAKIWDACSDMTGYVQMHFNVKAREELFGSEWRHLPSNDWKKCQKISGTHSEKTACSTIEEIIQPTFHISSDEIYDDDNNRVRFESIIEFPFFLLHVLKLYVQLNQIRHIDSSKNIVDELLDDKKLIDSYSRVLNSGIDNQGRKLTDRRADVTREIAVLIIRTRFLFDKYIIKREYANDSTDGEWSLKELRVSGQQSKKKAYYSNTRFIKSREWESTNNYRNKTNTMIEAALRVSYTSPKVMHWITKILNWLTCDGAKNISEENLIHFTGQAERIAKDAVRTNFFDKCFQNGKYHFAMGVNTPHIVFNYLDYLLWGNNRNKYSDFEFEFRNSVEHWYPQNPSGGTFEAWKDGVDQFGNLCIIQRNVNSRFSNMAPEAKKSTFREMISKGSLKLRIMSEITISGEGKAASMYWRKTAYKKHEEEMIKILMDACGISPI